MSAILGADVPADWLSQLRRDLAALVLAGCAAGRAEADAVAALVSLGYTRPSAQDAVQRAARESGADTDPETLIRTALQRLAGGKSQRG